MFFFFLLISLFPFLILFFTPFPSSWTHDMIGGSAKSVLTTTILSSFTFKMSAARNKIFPEKIPAAGTEEENSILDLPDLALESILSRLPASELRNMTGVCRSIREICTSDHLWEIHMKKKWGRIIGRRAHEEWKLRNSDFHGGRNNYLTSVGGGMITKFISVFFPLSVIKSKFFGTNPTSDKTFRFPTGSIMSLYLSLQCGKFWFPAQIYNRENGHVGFMLSCYDAEISYDRDADNFRARYPPHGRRTVVVENGIPWERIRAPPVETAAYDLHSSDCLTDLSPGGWDQVEPNQDFRGLVCEGANVLPSKFLEDAFRDEYGKIVNVRHIHQVVSAIDGWYRERDLFGRVSDIDILSGGIIKLQVSEAEVNNISMRFLDRKTGEPTVGKTKPETILRQLTTKKGQVYSLLQGKRDVETILTMGIMEDVSIIPQPAGDTGKVDLVMNLVERVSRGFSAGGGISSGITNGPLSGLIGSFAYSHRNVFGRNKKLNLSLERGQIDSIYRINYTDPWIDGDEKRTSSSFTIQNSKTPGTLVHGSQQPAQNITIDRVTAGIEFSRPLRPKWSGTSGITFQRASAGDDRGECIIRDFHNCPLTASGNTYDDCLLAKVETVYTDSGDRGSSMFVFNIEQGIPVLSDWLYFSRFNTRARKCIEFGRSRLVLSISGGYVLGNFCPHEAFGIGGINSVRGYEDGSVGSGRSYVVGSGEISHPLYGPVEGVVFADYGSDLGSGSTVPGDPAGARGKPGSGYGYGAGVRVNSPLGPLRLEYAINDKKAIRFHFGVGQRN